jgi:hypothetical protein
MRSHIAKVHNDTTIMYFIILVIHNLADTTCKLPEDGVLTPKHVGVILI